MKPCIVLGFGRSGTSLMGGILFHSGYYLGDDLFPPRESNPLGFFETDMINAINEKILASYDYNLINPDRQRMPGIQSSFSPVYGQRWLSYIDPSTIVECENGETEEEIRHVLSKPSFAYKDPRFSYTLPVWLRFLPADTQFICMFRDPGKIVSSVFHERKTADYLREFEIDTETIFRLWYNCYHRILNQLLPMLGRRLTFIHYEQLLTKEIIPKLSGILNHELDSSFVSGELNRSTGAGQVPEDVRLTYLRLCRLSDFQTD